MDSSVDSPGQSKENIFLVIFTQKTLNDYFFSNLLIVFSFLLVMLTEMSVKTVGLSNKLEDFEVLLLFHLTIQ